MYGMRSESVRVRRSRSPNAAARGAVRARRSSREENLGALLQHNVKVARVIAFETSPLRMLARHAYKNALVATRRLTGDFGKMKRTAQTCEHLKMVEQLDKCLRQCRLNAMVKSVSVSVAQDVFVLLSHYLGLCSVPDKSAIGAYAVRRKGSAGGGVQMDDGGGGGMSQKGNKVRASKQERVWFRRSVSHKQHMGTSLSTNSIGDEGGGAPAGGPVSYLSMPNVLAVAQKRRMARVGSVQIRS